jgi:predicted RNase H-like HicB family nuclease
MNYKILISFDKEYKGYVVDVPQLPGCMSQGKTIDEAIENVKDAIKGWLEVEEMLGRTHTAEESPVYLGEVFV